MTVSIVVLVFVLLALSLLTVALLVWGNCE